MSLANDLRAHVANVFREQWSSPDGRVVPAPDDLRLSDDAVKFDRATVLCADLTGSTPLVDGKPRTFAGESYRYVAARLINNHGGQITSYDGDRVMGVFVGESQTTSATACALKLNFAVQNIINPALKRQYPNDSYVVRQVVGIDTGEVRAARTDFRGGNDIDWIGEPANHAVKLTSLKEGPTWLTAAAFNMIDPPVKFAVDGRPMWEKRLWATMGNAEIYFSTFWWGF